MLHKWPMANEMGKPSSPNKKLEIYWRMMAFDPLPQYHPNHPNHPSATWTRPLDVSQICPNTYSSQRVNCFLLDGSIPGGESHQHSKTWERRAAWYQQPKLIINDHQLIIIPNYIWPPIGHPNTWKMSKNPISNLLLDPIQSPLRSVGSQRSPRILPNVSEERCPAPHIYVDWKGMNNRIILIILQQEFLQC